MALNAALPVQGVMVRFGLTARAVRHYEDVGLIRPARDWRNHRTYDNHTIERLEIVVALRRVGLSLREISNYLALRDAGDGPAHLDYATSRLEHRLKRLDRERLAIVAALENGGQPWRRAGE